MRQCKRGISFIYTLVMKDWHSTRTVYVAIELEYEGDLSLRL